MTEESSYQSLTAEQIDAIYEDQRPADLPTEDAWIPWTDDFADDDEVCNWERYDPRGISVPFYETDPLKAIEGFTRALAEIDRLREKVRSLRADSFADARTGGVPAADIVEAAGLSDGMVRREIRAAREARAESARH